MTKLKLTISVKEAEGEVGFDVRFQTSLYESESEKENDFAGKLLDEILETFDGDIMRVTYRLGKHWRN